MLVGGYDVALSPWLWYIILNTRINVWYGCSAGLMVRGDLQIWPKTRCTHLPPSPKSTTSLPIAMCVDSPGCKVSTSEHGLLLL